MNYKIIVDSNKIDPKSWSAFVYLHPNGNVFQTPEIYKTYYYSHKTQPIFVAVTNENDEILGLNIANTHKEHTGIIGVFSVRSIIMGGPLIKNNDPEILNLIIKEYSNQIRKKAIYTQFRNLWQWSDSENKIFLDNGFVFNDHLNTTIDLNLNKDVLLNNLHPGRRKSIRRAERVPLEFKLVTSDLEITKCEYLIKETYNRIKLPCPDKSFFESIKVNLVPKDYIKIFVAKYENQIISCRYVLCYKKMMYDWYAGTDQKHLDKYPNDFLPWKIIQWGTNNSYSILDFGGIGKPGIPYGVRDYKLRFGGNIFNPGRFEKTHNYILMHIGKLGLSLHKFL